MTVSATKELLHFIGTQEFVNQYGELFIILEKLNQDFVESFFLKSEVIKCVEVHKI